jgi:hypothetical protein
VLLGLDVHLASPQAPQGIVSLERAGTAAQAAAILEGWRRDGVAEKAWASLLLDLARVS